MNTNIYAVDTNQETEMDETVISMENEEDMDIEDDDTSDLVLETDENPENISDEDSGDDAYSYDGSLEDLKDIDESISYNEALKTLSNDKIELDFKITSRWTEHYNVDVTIKNVSDAKIEDWEIEFRYEDEIENIWNAKKEFHEGYKYKIKNDDWNQDIEAGESVTFGMTVKHDDKKEIEFPEYYKLTKECSENFDEYDVCFKENSRWGNHVSGEIIISNLSNRTVEDWKLELQTNLKIESIWNAEIVEEDSDIEYIYVNNANYNADIKAGGTVSFGIVATFDGEPEISENYLYEMTDTIDEESVIMDEAEEGQVRAQDEFDNSKEYEAYKVLRSAAEEVVQSMPKTISMRKAVKKTTTYATPDKASKATLKKKSIVYKIKNLRYTKTENKPKALQSFAIDKAGSIYLTQRAGANVKIGKCSGNSISGKNVVYSSKVKNKNSGKSETKINAEVMKVVSGAHGQTLAVFEHNKKKYALIGVNSRKEFSQSLAIVEFKGGTFNYNEPDKKSKNIHIRGLLNWHMPIRSRKILALLGE